MDWGRDHLRRSGAELINEMIDEAIGEMVATESPIELVFGAAAHVIMRTHYPLIRFLVDGGKDITEVQAIAKNWHLAWMEDPEMATYGVMAPQVQIGKYRADFVIVHRYGTADYSTVVVECDGHDFHEKTPKQAERDKRRDREMQMRGYRVFRFTGTEIVRDPFAAARSVLEPIAEITSISETATVLHRNGCDDRAKEYLRQIGVSVFDGGQA